MPCGELILIQKFSVSNGKWSDWSSWGDCSPSCYEAGQSNKGTETATRDCQVVESDDKCLGSDTKTQDCFPPRCRKCLPSSKSPLYHICQALMNAEPALDLLQVFGDCTAPGNFSSLFLVRCLGRQLQSSWSGKILLVGLYWELLLLLSQWLVL